MSNMPAATRARTDDSSVSYKSLADLTPDPRNANKGSQRGNAMIADSLREYGAGRSILLDRNGRIIAGNKTHENASAAGLADVIVVQSDGTKLVAVQRMDLDLDDPKAKQLAIADNRAGQVSLDWDIDVLKELAGEIDLAPFWSVDELEAMWPQNADLLTDEDAVPDLPEEAVTKPGDLYILGRHRLLCGDSTCVTDVERLMGGEKADMVFTDPPYGISIVQGGWVGGGERNNIPFGGVKNRKADIRGTDGASNAAKANKYVPVVGDDSTQTAVDAYNLCAGLDISVLIFWGGNYYADKLPPSSCWLVWDKENTGNFADAELAWTNQKTAVRLFRHMWNGMVKASERGERRIHPTQKPVALAEWAFKELGDPKSILDLFGGSGSTLIACEKTQRRCYMMEMAPAYCDVIVQRWEQATGQKAESDGAAA